MQEGVQSQFVCNDSKLLEVIMEHILIHWDDVMAVVVDELIEEEVIELNKIDELKEGKRAETKLANRSMVGKFHDYKNVDLREICNVFDDYNQAEQRVRLFFDD